MYSHPWLSFKSERWLIIKHHSHYIWILKTSSQTWFNCCYFLKLAILFMTQSNLPTSHTVLCFLKMYWNWPDVTRPYSSATMQYKKLTYTHPFNIKNRTCIINIRVYLKCLIHCSSLKISLRFCSSRIFFSHIFLQKLATLIIKYIN